MANLNGQQVADEVAFRISNRLSASTAQMMTYINDSLALITSAASWVWDQTTFLAIGGSGGPPATLTGCDPGKQISVFNSTTRTRVERVRAGEAFDSVAGYINVGQAAPNFQINTYRLTTTPPNSEPYLELYPTPGVGQTVDVIAHLKAPTLVYGSSVTVRWTVPEMDDLLRDLTESKVKRILGMAGWDILLADCRARIGEYKVMYSSERENTGTNDETKIVAEEKQTGRA